MAKIIVLMGAPGAGKGTQARLLQERLHLPQISTGDIFRALKHAETPLAQEVRDIMKRGQLVPDELTIQLVKDIVAILIDVPLDMLEKRMTGRRNCPVCNEIYNIYFKPPRNDNVCDLHPEAQLVQRADDNPETVRARLATYEEQTRPLVEYYKAAGLLQTVDGTGEPEAIYENIVRVLPRMNTD
jgi:adenylate kinase